MGMETEQACMFVFSRPTYTVRMHTMYCQWCSRERPLRKTWKGGRFTGVWEVCPRHLLSGKTPQTSEKKPSDQRPSKDSIPGTVKDVPGRGRFTRGLSSWETWVGGLFTGVWGVFSRRLSSGKTPQTSVNPPQGSFQGVYP